jgi:hypothetical protein
MKLLLIVALCASAVLAQQATGNLKGQVVDELGAVIVGANVVVLDANGKAKTVKGNDDGQFVVNGLAPGKYTVRVTTPGFALFEDTNIEVVSGKTQPVNVTLKVTIEDTKVTVASDSPTLSTEPENNAGAIVLKGADLDALPDDPDDLAAALQALAGPSAGPNGGQIFIDGFTGGRLPPLASIREIRINSNPFSSEYDRPGFGRIEILTKPGTDRFRGQASFGFNDNALNTRNPFAPNRPPYSSRNYGGNLSGPISKKKSSFFVDFEKRDVNDDALIVATILDPALNITSFREEFPTPSRRTTFSPRIDYQLNANNTLVGRYTYTHTNRLLFNGGTQLDTRAYNSTNTEQTVQLTETAVINKKIVNETRFQFIHQVANQNADNTIPTINVSDSFISGGPQVGQASNSENHFELTNNTSITAGHHSLKFGGRLRDIRINDISPSNFGGTWTFAGGGFGSGISSIQRYQITLRGIQQGLTPTQIRANGGGAPQFSIATGDPLAAVSQWDFGGFFQDDWKMRPSLTVNLGLRYENQANISSNLNFAPRFGFAWAPGYSASKPSKTVVRGGFGIFYDRISESLTLQEDRFNGVNQRQFIVTNPAILDSFPNVPSIAALTAFATPVTIYQLANDVRAPYTMQSVIGVERSLPHNFTLTASFINARSLHLLRAQAINAPLPGTFVPGVFNSGIRPFSSTCLGVPQPGIVCANNIFQYETSGRFNQNQLIIQVVNRLSRSASVTAFYSLAQARSDTDGSGTFAANPYDVTGEYGRSSQDIRHRFTLLGNYRGPWGLSFSPMVQINSGRPFNITLGRDLNGDTLFTERPAFATDLTKPGVIITKWGAFDPNPTPGEQIIPRNFGTGPMSITTRLGISKTFGFGKEVSTTASRRQNGQGGAGGAGGGRGIPGMGGAGGARGGGARGGGGGGGGFGGGDGAAARRYNLTISVNTQNIFNYANQGNPSGNLSSPFFGISTSSGGNFGGFGGGGGACSGACNRRIDLQARFSF